MSQNGLTAYFRKQEPYGFLLVDKRSGAKPPEDLYTPIGYTAYLNLQSFVSEGSHVLKAGIDGQPYIEEIPKPEEIGVTAKEIYEAKLLRLTNEYNDQCRALTDKYPAYEKLTWEMQEREANKYLEWLDDQERPSPALPFLENLHRVRSEGGNPQTLEELAIRIIVLSNELAPSIAALTGIRQVYTKLLEDNKNDKEALENISWSWLI